MPANRGLFHLALALLLGGVMSCATLHDTRTGSRELFQKPEGVQTRWASPENWSGEKGQAGQIRAGRKGSAFFALKAGEQKVLAEVKGRSGVVRGFWLTISERGPEVLRGLKLEMFWDGAAQPAVAAPLGDFFCQGLGRMSTFENALFASPEGRSFYCYIPMPFRTGMRIVVTNESGRDVPMFFYDVDYTLGDRHGKEMLYFHAIWRRENPTTLRRDFEILPKVEGRGRYLGTNLSVIADSQRYFDAWWGEGEVKVYLDGDGPWPTLCGTGTEDYIGTGWGQNQYAHQYRGSTIADLQHSQFAFYRFHVPDPVWFDKDCRVTIQQIGCWGPESRKKMREAGNTYYLNNEQPDKTTFADPMPDFGTFERQDDWAACAYFYLDRPVNGLPALAPSVERIKGLLSEGADAGKRQDVK